MSKNLALGKFGINKNSSRIRVSAGRIVFNIFNYSLLTLFMFCCIYPFYYIIINSLSSSAGISKGVAILPKEFNIEAYKAIFEDGSIASAFFISVSRVVVSTSLVLIFSAMFAYLVTQKELPFRKVIYRFAIITMYVGGGLIPWYLTMRAYGLQNTFLLYIVPGMFNCFFVILMKTFMEQLPSSLEESAKIDGAGFFTVFIKIIFPLIIPIVATCAVFNAVGQWNAWMDNFLLVSDKRLNTIQLILFNVIGKAESIAREARNAADRGEAVDIEKLKRLSDMVSPMGVRMATTVVTTLPIILVYPYMQKHFVKGIMMGAIKG